MDAPQEITVLCGFPPCPECDTTLSLRSMPDAGETHWHCTTCGTQWNIVELIAALNLAARVTWALGIDDEVE